MILSRTAGSLYWIGRYIERAEFTANLVEATLRLDVLATRPAGPAAWESALKVAAATQDFIAAGKPEGAVAVADFMLLSPANASSSYKCIEAARANGRAVRSALSDEAWLSINHAWTQLQKREQLGTVQDVLALIEDIKVSARAFEGALHRMLRNEAQCFIALGAAIERANGTARLLDVKYHLLLPEGERVGGTVDRDQWTAILRTVSALAAFRWLYRDGLQPRLVAELLVLQQEFPRSLCASMERAAEALTSISHRSGFEGEADSSARSMVADLQNMTGAKLVQLSRHEYLQRFVRELTGLNRTISSQFNFA